MPIGPKNTLEAIFCLGDKTQEKDQNLSHNQAIRVGHYQCKYRVTLTKRKTGGENTHRRLLIPYAEFNLEIRTEVQS